MQETAKSQDPDRWWIVALCVAVVGVVLIWLVWSFPASKWVWAFAGGILIFVVVLYHNPRYRYWRRANWCFGAAGILALVPTFVVKATLQQVGVFELASDSSPLGIMVFLGAGLFLSWLDTRQPMYSPVKADVDSSITNPSTINSPQAITGLISSGNIIIHQGISENTLLATLDAQRLAQHVHLESVREAHKVDEELLWRLIDDIKAARRRFEREEVAQHLSNLRRIFEHSGNAWPKTVRTEALLLMAEAERAKISQSRTKGHQVDLSRFQELLKELRDA